MKHNRYANCRVELAGEIAIPLPTLSCSKGVASYPELVINASYALLLLNAYVALSRS